MPVGWSPYPSAQEIAEFEALMLEVGAVERDVPPHADDAPQPVISYDDPVGLLSLLSAQGSGADGFDLSVLEGVDPAALADPVDRLAVLKALGKVECLVGALRIRALTALGGTEPCGAYLDEVHVEHEIAVASRISEYAAGKALDLARTITSSFPDFLTALRAGRVSWGHLAVLVDRTQFVTDKTALAEISTRALPRALTRTAGQFATEVEKLVARFDPDAAERHRKAKKKERKVWVKRLADGMGILGYVDEWAVVNAVYETIAADARATKKARKAAGKAGKSSGRRRARDTSGTPSTDLVATGGRAVDPLPEGGPGGPDVDSDVDADTATSLADIGTAAPETASADLAAGEDEPSADSARADALAARVLGTLNPDGSVVWERAASMPVHVNLTIDFLTLVGERDRIALLDGQPVPMEIAREFAAVATTFRRFVTDPVDDHLIDRGTKEYTNDHLRAFVLDRDICRNPVHQHSSSSTRLEMDQAEEWPHGPTAAGNCGGVCIPSHQLKTARRVDITDSQADGSCTWTTQWGQVIHVPARPFLDLPDPPAIEYVDSEPEHGSDDPAPVSGAGPPSADDPPPF